MELLIGLAVGFASCGALAVMWGFAMRAVAEPNHGEPPTRRGAASR